MAKWRLNPGYEVKILDDWLTVGEIEQQTRIPERTLRRYLELHGHHLQTRKQGRSILVAKLSLTLLQQIRDWYAAGWNAQRVEEALSESGLPVTLAVDGREMPMTVTEALQALQQSVGTAMTAMAREVANLREEVAASRKETEKLRTFLDDRLEARDRQLMETLRRMQERTTEQSQSQKKASWWPWKR